MELKAISCVIGAVLINLTLGTFYSISNLVPYVASYMRENVNADITSEHGTWITASFLLGQGIFIIVGSYIEQNYDSRIACLFGCTLHSVSTFMTIWAINSSFTAVILIYGFGSGLGCGSAYMASIIAAQKWFPSNKGIFTGIIVAGFGLGGLIFTNLQTLYLNPDNIPADSSGYFSRQVYEKIPNLFLYMGIIFSVAQTIGCILAFPPPKSPLQTIANTSEPVQGNTIVSEVPLPDMRNVFSTFKYKIFYITGLMMMLVAPGVTFVNSLGKRYGQSYIKDDRYLATVVAVAAVANAFGRLTWGFLADKFTFSVCFTVKVFLFAILIIFFPFAFVLSSKFLYLIWMLGLFFGFSGTFVLFPVFIEQVFGVKYHGIIYGILYLFLAASSIVTSFIIQVTVGPGLAKPGNPDDKLYVRIGPCAIIAVSYALSIAIYFLSLPTKRLDAAIRRRKEVGWTKTKDTLFNRQDLHPIERGTLSEKTLPRHNDDSLHKENSLGSIVRFGETPQSVNENRLKRFGKAEKK